VKRNRRQSSSHVAWYIHSLLYSAMVNCCIKPHVHYCQFVLWYTFFIWNDLEITNLCFVLLLHNSIINRTFNRTSCICHRLGLLLHEQSVADELSLAHLQTLRSWIHLHYYLRTKTIMRPIITNTSNMPICITS